MRNAIPSVRSTAHVLRSRVARTIALGCVASLMAATLPIDSALAQEVRGTVVHPDDTTPAFGAVVLLVHGPKDSIVARVVTGTRGTFALTAPASLPVQLRVLRLGFQPTNVGTYTLTAGQTQNVRVKLNEQQIVLERFDIAATRRCDVKPAGARLVAQLHEEARKALLASTTPTSSERHQAQFTLYTRAQTQNGRLAAPIERSAFSGPSTKPFASLPADSLAKVGYVVEQADGTIYRAPDADVLLANSFLESHCLQLVDGTNERAGYVGIGFKPVQRNPKITDVQGTLWLDRETNALQFLEYEYVGVPETHTKAGVGGRVDYTQMGAGLWFVNRWAIRMPRYKARNNQRLDGMRGELLNAADFDGLQIIGGEVQWLKVDDETLYSNTGALQAGSDPRDVLDIKVAGTSFEVDTSAARVTTVNSAAAIDTVFTSASCVAVGTPGYTGQVNGKIKIIGQGNASSAPVIAEWKEDFRTVGSKEILWQVRQLETRAKDNGDYVMCGLPIARPVTLSATHNGRKSRVSMVRLTPKEPRTTMNMSVGDNVGSVFTAADAAYKGAVMFVTDEQNVPIPFATINLGSNVSRVSDEDGRIMLALAPKDSIRLTARRIGYAQFDGKVGRDSVNGPYRVKLRSTSQKLVTINVNAQLSKSPLQLTGFYDRMLESQRGAIVGEFYTPEDLEARPSIKVTQFLRQSRFLGFGKDDKSTVVTGRGMGCTAAIVVDGIRARNIIETTLTTISATPEGGFSVKNHSGRDQGKLDIDDLVSAPQVSAIEVYPSAMHAPSAIASQVAPGESMCSIVAIWTGGRNAK